MESVAGNKGPAENDNSASRQEPIDMAALDSPPRGPHRRRQGLA